jgi:hypothetical protein
MKWLLIALLAASAAWAINQHIKQKSAGRAVNQHIKQKSAGRAVNWLSGPRGLSMNAAVQWDWDDFDKIDSGELRAVNGYYPTPAEMEDGK